MEHTCYSLKNVPMVVTRRLLALFLLPGNLVCDAVAARAGDDRSMIRSLVNMLVWNFVAVIVVVTLW